MRLLKKVFRHPFGDKSARSVPDFILARQVLFAKELMAKVITYCNHNVKRFAKERFLIA